MRFSSIHTTTMLKYSAEFFFDDSILCYMVEIIEVYLNNTSGLNKSSCCDRGVNTIYSRNSLRLYLGHNFYSWSIC